MDGLNQMDDTLTTGNQLRTESYCKNIILGSSSI